MTVVLLHGVGTSRAVAVERFLPLKAAGETDGKQQFGLEIGDHPASGFQGMLRAHAAGHDARASLVVIWPAVGILALGEISHQRRETVLRSTTALARRSSTRSAISAPR